MGQNITRWISYVGFSNSISLPSCSDCVIVPRTLQLLQRQYDSRHIAYSYPPGTTQIRRRALSQVDSGQSYFVFPAVLLSHNSYLYHHQMPAKVMPHATLLVLTPQCIWPINACASRGNLEFNYLGLERKLNLQISIFSVLCRAIKLLLLHN